DGGVCRAGADYPHGVGGSQVGPARGDAPRATSSISLRGQPMSPTVTSPKYRRALGLEKPAFSATKVTVRVARMQAGPRDSPVSQSRPLGMSTARMGTPASFIH